MSGRKLSQLYLEASIACRWQTKNLVDLESTQSKRHSYVHLVLGKGNRWPTSNVADRMPRPLAESSSRDRHTAVSFDPVHKKLKF